MKLAGSNEYIPGGIVHGSNYKSKTPTELDNDKHYFELGKTHGRSGFRLIDFVKGFIIGFLIAYLLIHFIK